MKPAAPVATEHAEQVAFFRWAAISANQNPVLHLLFAIPNGGARSKRTAALLKAEGVKAGVPDIFFPCARGPYHGLFIEMKRWAKSRVREHQSLWMAALTDNGYKSAVCYGWEQARAEVVSYLEFGSHKQEGRP